MPRQFAPLCMRWHRAQTQTEGPGNTTASRGSLLQESGSEPATVPLDPHHGLAVRLEEYIRQHGVWSEGSGS